MSSPRLQQARRAVRALAPEDKAALTAGRDLWTIPGIAEAGVPPITVTDGPNGARGSALLGLGRVTAVCVPCGSALGATFDPDLIEDVGRVLGQEARTKGARVLLAPTLNLHRHPLAGRNFECYSEDPLLSGRIAAAFVRGVQAEGVGATAKHFVGNESEHQRGVASSDISERALRELYLVPFEMAVRDGGLWLVMTAYNRVNGCYVSEDPDLLTGWLRDEVGFDGVVMTDWFGAGDTVASARAGLDLQMPGPGRFFGSALADAVRDGRLDETTLDAAVDRWLRLIDRLGAWDDPDEPVESSIDRPEHRAVARRAARSSMVLLANDGTLPLRSDLGSLALIGPNSASGNLMGGGSAKLRAHYVVAPLEPLAARLGDRLAHEPGCSIDKSPRPLGTPYVTSPNGEPGVVVEYFDDDSWSAPPAATDLLPDMNLLLAGPVVATGPGGGYTARARGTFRAPVAGPYTFGLAQAGRARLVLDGSVVLDGFASPFPVGTELFGMLSDTSTHRVELAAGQAVDVMVEHASSSSTMLHGARVTLEPPTPIDAVQRAVAAAAAAEVAVVVVGTNDEWESEGHDRESMHLPGEQDELIRRICAANPRTVVVVNAGAAVAMDWADDAAAIVQCWLGGQEMAAALDQVLFGEAEPAGRLPFSVPIRIEHSPAFGAFPADNLRQPYGEDLLMGYRWFDTRALPVRFPFGHGGSYTTFEWGEPSVIGGETVRVEVPVRNAGARPGAEVVQCYVAPPPCLPCRLYRPARELRGFQKLWLDPGAEATAVIELDDRAFAYYDPGTAELAGLVDKVGPLRRIVLGHAADPEPRSEPGWYVDAGAYRLELGRSLVDIVTSVEVERAAARVGVNSR